MEEGLEKQWRYYLSEKGDWVRQNDDEYELKAYGRSEWVAVEKDKFEPVAYLVFKFFPLSDLWGKKLSEKEQQEKLIVTIKKVFVDASNYEIYSSCGKNVGFGFRSKVPCPEKKLKQQFGVNQERFVRIKCVEGAMNEVIIYGPPFRQLWHSLPATDEGLKAKFENKDPSTDKELTAIAFGLLNDDKKADINPVDELIKILTDRANTIGKWYYWNGMLKSRFLKACIGMIEDAKIDNESLTLEEALAETVDADSVMGQRFGKRSNQKPLTTLNAMNWHRHFFRNEKAHTKTHDKADDVCRFSFLETLGVK